MSTRKTATQTTKTRLLTTLKVSFLHQSISSQSGAAAVVVVARVAEHDPKGHNPRWVPGFYLLLFSTNHSKNWLVNGFQSKLAAKISSHKKSVALHLVWQRKNAKVIDIAFKKTKRLLFGRNCTWGWDLWRNGLEPRSSQLRLLETGWEWGIGIN